MPRRVIRHPQHDRDVSLGWLATWWIESFVVHGRGGAQGTAIRYGDEVTGFIVDCYAHDSFGRRFYNSAFLSRPKGTDKSGVAAALSLFEAFGPSRFAGIAEGGETYEFLGKTYVYAAGEVMGKPIKSPMVKIMATEEGQPLALDTPVMTTNGWSTVGAIQIGDFVFGSDGMPVEVKRTTRVFTDLDCYEITFNDGEKITASGSHLWTLDHARTKDGRHVQKTVTTEQMSRDWHGVRGNRYRLRVTPAMQMPDTELPVDPYFLGLWLGDGKAADSSLCYDYIDHDYMVGAIEKMMLPGESPVYSTGPGVGVVRIKREHGRRSLTTLRNRLREVGVLGNKHVPELYHLASEAQRMAVLQGLMDSDGTICKDKGRAIFTNADRRLIDGIERLLTGLGFKWDERYDESVGAWRVGFQPTAESPVFRIPRKVERCRPASASPRSMYRHIVNIERVESVPVRCLGIDNEDHLFAAGERMVLTHNTGNVYDNIYYNLNTEGAPLYALKVAYGVEVGKTQIVLPNGGWIRPTSAGAASKDGGLETFAVFDETHLYTTPTLRAMYKTVVRNLAKRRKEGTWFIETTTMYEPGSNSIAEDTYTVADAAEEKKLRRNKLLFDHQWAQIESLDKIKVPDPDNPRRKRVETDDEYEARLKAGFVEAYGDAIAWNDLDGLLDDLFDPRSDESDTIRYFFNAVVEGTNTWLRIIEWDRIGVSARLKAAKASGEKYIFRPPSRGDEIAIGFDGGISDDATVLIGCRISDNYVFPIRVWEAPDSREAKTWAIDPMEVEAELASAFKKYKVVAFLADPPHWQDYVERWETTYGPHLTVRVSQARPIAFSTNNHVAMAKVVERAETAIKTGEVTHGNNPILTRHVRNAHRWRRNTGDVIGKDRRGGTKKMDAAVGMCLAIEGAALYRKQPKRKTAVPVRVR